MCVCGFEHQQEMYRKSHPAAIAENVGALAATRSNASYHQGQYVIPVVSMYLETLRMILV